MKSSSVVLFLSSIIPLTLGAPFNSENPDSEVELVPPVQSSGAEESDGNRSENDTNVVVVVEPVYDEYEYDQQGSFGFGGVPSSVGFFDGFRGGRPGVGKSDPRSFPEYEYEDPGITVTFSLNTDRLGQNSEGQGFSLTEFLRPINSGNQQNQFGFRNFEFDNRKPNSGSRKFGFNNQQQGLFGLEGFFRKPQSGLLNIFGSHAGSLKPLFGLGDIIGRGTVQQVTPSVGVFSSLTGGPWPAFQNIFALYNRPEVRGYREVFGPVSGLAGGCGLCQLFTSDTISGEGAVVTIELVDDIEERMDEYDYQVLEAEAIPGGTVVMLNETTIRILDGNNEGIYFLLNTDPTLNESEEEEEATNVGVTDQEIIEDDILVEDKNIENATPKNESVDQNTSQNEIIGENSTRETVTETIDDGLLEESSTDSDTDNQLTTQLPTQLPPVFDEGRFDIANDKIKSKQTSDALNGAANYPKTDIVDTTENLFEMAKEGVQRNITDFGDKTTESQTSPTLYIENIDNIE